ncbi:hypothetical protein [Streptomyces sp. NL15-2K]|uniref:hypothetical protein n=1 Tax=Streptomyces sp. NL15-2K TaxID=376149 RepID=UPI000F57D3A3|nr:MULTISPECIES: hypothetical protein [Actinomycetes]WKX07499.1 hypothetical protein Q4V64_08355 [Kutzneria buriramensis]GCB51255.1 hypothetical protein SNL152K_8611 [Streptomyces sp. NL15-2K]
MARSAPIHVRVTASGLPAHDPLDLYEELRRTHPVDDVFLLENASGTGRDPDRAVVGCGRLLDIRVIAGTRGVTVRLTGEPALVRALLGHAEDLGLRRAATPAPTGSRGSSPS